MNVRKNSALGNGDILEELVKFLIVSNCKLNVARNDSRLLVVCSGVASEFQNLRSQVLQYCGQINRCTSTNSSGIFSFLKVSLQSRYGKLQTRLNAFRSYLLIITYVQQQLNLKNQRDVNVLLFPLPPNFALDAGAGVSAPFAFDPFGGIF